MRTTHGSKVRRAMATVGLAAGALAIMTGTAGAHINPTEPEGPAGGEFTTAFQIGHGCEDQATTKVEIKIPEGVTSVRPADIAGWEVSTTTRKVDPPIEVNGEKISETVDTVSWEGGPLPTDANEQFGMTMRLPNGKAGDQLVFPVIQSCGSTTQEWLTAPKEGEPEPDHPAPFITLTAGEGSGDSTAGGSNEGDHHDSGAAESPESTMVTTATGTDAPVAVDAAEDAGENSNTLAIVALVIAVIGVALGGVALFRSSGGGASDKNSGAA